MMEDFLGAPISVGDYVLVTATKYKDFNIARVVKFTDKRIVLQWRLPMFGLQTLLRDPKQVVKLGRQDALAFILSNRIDI